MTGVISDLASRHGIRVGPAYRGQFASWRCALLSDRPKYPPPKCARVPSGLFSRSRSRSEEGKGLVWDLSEFTIEALGQDSIGLGPLLHPGENVTR
jgi:hypothetical protein